MIGQTLGHYEILEKLGEGGMGRVYLAKDTTLDRKVALKVLPTRWAESQERIERFEREAKVLAALDHPIIVTIHTVEEADGLHFLTMQLVDGKRLSELIPKAGMSVERIFDIAIPLADALAAAHERGVIHRDLKPGNIMVTEEGRVKVLDFGLAKLRQEEVPADQTELPTEPLTVEGRILGTMPYMSPEQLEGVATLDGRSDIFSLGVVLYEMATGERPFQGASSVSVISAIMKESPVDVDLLRDDLPHHLGRVVRRCLEKEPDRRYQRAKDLLHELEDLRREISTEVPTRADASLPLPRRLASRRWAYAVTVLFALLAAVAVYHRTQRPQAPPAPREIRSIAVLPLTNLMNDPEQEYFVDGMTDALIASLAKIGDLKVISRTSAMRYKEVEKPLPEIASELGVDALIEGSVLRSGDEVRVTAQLIDGRTDEHLWVETYDRNIENVLGVHSDVARAVAEEVQVALTEDEEDLLAAQQVNPEAQEAYLKGNYFLNRLAVDQALEYFGRAAEQDPTFALPLAGRATTFIGAAVVGGTPPTVLYPEAEKAASAALELNENLAAAHAALGWVRLWSDWDWPAAGRRFRRAVELNPSDPGARWGYSNYYLVMQQPDEAMAQAEICRRLDPLSPLTQYGVVWNLYLARRFDAVLEQGRKVLDMFPNHEFIHALMMNAYFQQGQFAESLRELPRAMRPGGPWRPAFEAVLAGGLDESDFVGVWRAMLENVEAQATERYINPSEMAHAFMFAHEPQQLIDWLEKMVEEREPLAVYLVLDPAWDLVRSEPRFRDLVQRMNLPQSSGASAKP